MNVGDSLVEKLQEAITGASGLLVVLSKSSVRSQWCKKELNSGLIRELEDKRVILLPVLIDNCTIPLFLREKLYADFRTDFDAGLVTLLEAIASVTNEWRGRLAHPEFHTDWAIDWGIAHGNHIFRLTMVDHARSQPYCVLGVISIIAGSRAGAWYEAQVEKQQDHIARREIVYALAEAVGNDNRSAVRLEDQHEVFCRISFKLRQLSFSAVMSVRWLGMDTGRDVIFRFGSQINGIVNCMREITKQEEQQTSRADTRPPRRPSRRKKNTP